MMGVRQTTDFLEKATWTMAGILVVLCLVSSITIPKNAKEGTQKSAVENTVTPDLQTETSTTTMGTTTTETSGETTAPTEASTETNAE